MTNISYKLNKSIVLMKHDTTVSLFDPDESYIYTLNETGTYIYKQLKKNLPTEKIVLKLMKKYQIKKIIAERDLDELLHKLEKHHIITLT